MKACINTLCALALLVSLHTASGADKTVIRLGHFPNITHVQALVAHNLSRQGKGWFEQRLGPDVEIQWFSYNAGPSAMEAIFANSIDMTYVGPSPALNAYSKSRGAEIRIVSGAANGGSALVIQPDSPIKTGADFRGKKIATPQLGNTQDVSCRSWLAAQGLKITQLGGDAQVLPTANPDQLTLFLQKQIDAVWTVEPWVSRLELEAGGKVFLEEPDSITTVLVSSTKFLKEHRELVQKLVKAHRELTEWVKNNPEEAQKIVKAELGEEMKREVAAPLIAHAWKRILLTDEVKQADFQKFVANAQSAGFLKDAPDLSRLVETP
ncbi:MAG: ABC transporter substrate-binding protein [Verrucomicrobiota bacterium]